jgi:integrase
MSKKRGHGEGSIYRRKDGRWCGEYLVNGKKRYLYAKTRKAVAPKLTKALAEKDADLTVDLENLSLEKYMDRWLDSIRDTVREGTYKPYEAITRLHIKPTLGKTKLGKLNALQLQSLYREKLDSGLSSRRVRYIHVTIHKALKDAVKLQLVNRNVAEAVTPPRLLKREIQPLTQAQMRSLLEAAKDEKLYGLYVLAVTTGMRQGELLGLKWKDIDFDAGTLRVNRSVYNGKVSPPTTNSSRRTIRLSKLAIRALKRHRVNTAKLRISEWVFSTGKGTPISNHNLHNRSWKPLLKCAGLPDSTRFHDLRHSCISLLLSWGVPVKVVSEMAGHADVSITLSVYGHVLPDMQSTAADGIDETLG